jgi:hypothetical protein
MLCLRWESVTLRRRAGGPPLEWLGVPEAPLHTSYTAFYQ